MGKGDLWDDSALINAFDDAISSYKKMHKGNSKDSSAEAEEEKVMGTSTQESGSNVEYGNLDTARDAEEKSEIPATVAPDSDETCYVSKTEQNHLGESQADQTCLDSMSGNGIHSEHDDYAYAQGLDDYNQLVAKYYELEEKRLKIWEQINQYSGWNYQYATTASSSDAQHCSAHDYSMHEHQVSEPNAVCTCCPCFRQCVLASCTLVPAWPKDGSCAGKPGNHHSVEMDEDGKISITAMGAAESALHTIRTAISGDSNLNEESDRKIPEHDQINGTETDLSAVLNAWYSAGYYTGKYLAEQSIANRRQK